MKWYIDNPDRQAEERRYIAVPSRWPRWPLLPVKRSGPYPAGLECGCLLAGEGSPVKIYKVNPHSLKENQLLRPQLEEAGTLAEYPSLEAMQAEGWRID